MRALAGFIMRGPTPAVAVTAVSAVLALIVMPLGYLSGAAVALVGLRLGWYRGLTVAGGATVAVALLSWALIGNPWIGPAFLLTLWLPVWAMAERLRHSAALAQPLLLAAGLGMLLVLGMHLVLSDPAAWWLASLTEVTGALEGAGSPGGPSQEVLQDLARVMTALIGASFALTLVLCLLLGRWWQALLYNPGGFRDEFQGLQLGRAPTAVAAVLFVLASLGESGLALVAGELLLVLLMTYLFQGLAVVHALVTRTKAHTAWLVGMYLLLLFALPQTAATLAVAGVADNWFGFRRFFGSKTE